MKVLDLGSLEIVRSTEIEPAGSISLISGVQSYKTATGGELAWYTFPVSLDHLWSVAVKGYQQHEAKLKTRQIYKIYLYYYCAFVSAR